MKRIGLIMLSIALLLTVMVIPVMAETDGGTAVVSSADGAPGDVVYVTVSISGFAEANTILVTFPSVDGLELNLEESEWLQDGELSDISGQQAVWAVREQRDLNGDILKLAFRLQDDLEKETQYNITCDVYVKNNDTELGSAAATGTVTAYPFARGDINCDHVIDTEDVADLLWHTLFPNGHPILGNGDINGDNAVTDADVAYLLWHTLFPDRYPL